MTLLAVGLKVDEHNFLHVMYIVDLIEQIPFQYRTFLYTKYIHECVCVRVCVRE